MKPDHHTRTEAAIYWSAISLIVCEGLSIRRAAERLGVDGESLRKIMRQRRTLRPLHTEHCEPSNGLLQ